MTDQKQSLTLELKSPKRNAHPKSTPIRQRIPQYIWRLLDWCMIQPKQMVRRNRIGEKGTQLTINNHLPIHQKSQNGTPKPYLRPSDSIFLIYSWCLSDWCMLQAKQTVRRNRIGKKGTQLTRHNHSPCHQKHQNGTPTPNLLLPDSIFLIYIR